MVAGQDTQVIQSRVIQYLHDKIDYRYKLTVTPLHGGSAFQTEENNPGIPAALEALEMVHGVPAVCQGEGGSIPIVATLKSLGLDSILIGMNQLDDGLHAPNERFAIADYKAGIKVSMAFLTKIAKSI